MFKLDNQFLTDLGLGGLPVDEKNRLLQMIYERLEMNVGMRLAEKMTDAQLDEFEAFIDRNDEAGALKWLETNFPNYKDVVAEELEKLKVEVRQAAPQILSAAQNAPQAPQYGQPVPQQPMPAQPAQPTAADLMSYQRPPTPPQYGQPVYGVAQQPAFSPQQPQYQQPMPTPPVPQPYQPVPQTQPQPYVQPVQQPVPQSSPAPDPMQPTQPQQPQQFTPPPPGFTPGQ